ncbi:4-hydroxybenzoate 3-monooxygenase [Actibacterium lipolyticum]|uniref:p-hydroxybenzoate hydroxylase n=1 Tax=Actibacterium lipolyticum TaxID=1524263 RepID=A0A238LA02_9RHOB|nr:4-hydroxybenzoate 3-monooxygenase [Actibacterium lipolyticum]SMX51192.1 p-hydroxybenzoate hydroxylase [Actibacterium lipolyticum]
MTLTVKTDVTIIGGGPAGMLLAHMLDQSGIRSVVIERKTREYVLGRIRAGMLEAGTVDIFRQFGLAERLDRECMIQEKVHYGYEGKDTLVLDLKAHTGRWLTAYGQTALTEELYKEHERAGRPLFDAVQDAQPEGFKSSPVTTFTKEGQSYRVESQYIVGCDGSHGVSRNAIPKDIRKEWTREYPFGWLGVLAEVPPMPQLFYARHSDGFVLASKRTPTLSRYYVQVPTLDTTRDWSDDRFWDAIYTRLPESHHGHVTPGPSIEKSIAPLRSFVSEPMQYGRLFLAGDAAHIVPPTGAKGLNLAVSDVYYLHRALDAAFNQNNQHMLENYGQTALRRVWAAINLSWRLTKLMHVFPGEASFEAKLRDSEFDLLLHNPCMQAAIAHEKVGLKI